MAAAKSQFNNPFSQLKSLFLYMADDTLSGALVGRDVESATLYLTTTLPIPTAPAPQPSSSNPFLPPAPPDIPPRASGSGLRSIFDAPVLPSAVNFDSAADFIIGKLSRVFNRKGNFPRQDLITLLAANNGNLLLARACLGFRLA